jgi:hypothetical protein
VLLDIDSFRLGAPIVTEMARAVEESRFTVAVVVAALRHLAEVID